MFSWHFMAREISIYNLCSMEQTMNSTAQSVAESSMIIHYKMRYNELTKSKLDDPYR